MRIAITGTLAAGKSTFSNILRRMGYPVFDSDNYAKLAYRKRTGHYEEIVKLLGEGVLDGNGEVDFKKVSEVIFNDLSLKRKLEDIIHPFVLAGMQKMMDKANKVFFAEVPLLYEAGMEKYFDKVIVITCDDEIAVERCIEDRGYTKEKAVKIVNTQLNKKDKIERADYVLYNNGTIKDLYRKTSELLKEIGV